MIRDDKEEQWAEDNSASAFKSLAATHAYPAREDTLERRTRRDGATPFTKAAKTTVARVKDPQMDQLEEQMYLDQ